MGVKHTSDRQTKEELQTRWYKASIIEAKNAIFKITKQRTYELKGEVETYNELYFVNNKFNVVFTITSLNAKKTAIDLSVESKSFLSSPKNEIIRIYQLLNQELEFLGTRIN